MDCDYDDETLNNKQSIIFLYLIRDMISLSKPVNLYKALTNNIQMITIQEPILYLDIQTTSLNMNQTHMLLYLDMR